MTSLRRSSEALDQQEADVSLLWFLVSSRERKICSHGHPPLTLPLLPSSLSAFPTSMLFPFLWQSIHHFNFYQRPLPNPVI